MRYVSFAPTNYFIILLFFICILLLCRVMFVDLLEDY